MQSVVINYLAVLVAAVAGMAIGAAWYSPLLFGKQWMKLSGLSEADMEAAKKKGLAKLYLINFVGTLVMAYVLAYFLEYLDIAGRHAAVQAAGWLWLGFIATVSLGGVLWEGKPWKLWLFNNAYQLLSLAVMAVILVSWK